MVWQAPASLADTRRGYSSTQITVNYADEGALFACVSLMFGQRRQPVHSDCGFNAYTFLVGPCKLVLRHKVLTVITDFDLVTYDPVIRNVLYKDQLLPSGLLEKFERRRCTLRFNPYARQDESAEWTLRRIALPNYLDGKWKFFDSTGLKVTFVNADGGEILPEPDEVWAATPGDCSNKTVRADDGRPRRRIRTAPCEVQTYPRYKVNDFN